MGDIEKVRVFSFEHHRTGGIDDDERESLIHEGEKSFDVATGFGLCGGDVAGIEGGHSAAAGAAKAHRETVVSEHFHDGFSDFGSVVVDETGGEEDDFAVFSGALGGVLAEPLDEGFAVEGGEFFIAVDAESFFHEGSEREEGGGEVGEGCCRTGEFAETNGMAENSIAERDALFFDADRLGAEEEFGKVELELVAFAGGIGAVDVAELALEAFVDDAFCGFGFEGADVAFGGVDGVEERGKRRAKLETETTSVTEFKRAGEFFLEGVFIPKEGFVGVIGEAVGGTVLNRFHCFLRKGKGGMRIPPFGFQEMESRPFWNRPA